MTRPTAILLSPRPLVVTATRDLGVRTVVLAPDLGATPSAAMADAAFQVDWTDPVRLKTALATCLDGAAPASVFGFGESSALAAARANEEFGLPGNPACAVQAFTDKAVLRARVNARLATPVRWAAVDTKADLDRAVAEVGFPLVAKPRAGVGSAGVRKICDESELQRWASTLAEDCQLIVEEFLPGEEYSVEAVTAGRRHEVLAITRKSTTGAPNFVETGHAVPARVDGTVAAQIAELVRITLDEAGHLVGPSHTEVIVGTHGPRLVESHGRPGGDRITDLVQLATGVDIFAATIAATLGLSHRRPPDPGRFAAIEFLRFPPGRLVEVRGVDAARAVPGVVEVEVSALVGAPVPDVVNSTTRHGFVVAAGDTEAAVRAAIRAATAAIVPVCVPRRAGAVSGQE